MPPRSDDRDDGSEARRLYGRGHQQQEVRFGPPHTPDVVKTLHARERRVFIVQQIGSTASRSGSPRRPRCSGTAALWQPFTYMWLPRRPAPHRLQHARRSGCSARRSPPPGGAKRFLRFYLICGVGAGLLIVRAARAAGAPRPRHPGELSAADARRLGRDLRRAARLLAHLARPHDHAALPADPDQGDLVHPVPVRRWSSSSRRRRTSATSATWAACSSAGSSSAARAACRSCPRKDSCCTAGGATRCGASSTRCGASSSAPGATTTRLH